MHFNLCITAISKRTYKTSNKYIRLININTIHWEVFFETFNIETPFPQTNPPFQNRDVTATATNTRWHHSLHQFGDCKGICCYCCGCGVCGFAAIISDRDFTQVKAGNGTHQPPFLWKSLTFCLYVDLSTNLFLIWNCVHKCFFLLFFFSLMKLQVLFLEQLFFYLAYIRIVHLYLYFRFEEICILIYESGCGRQGRARQGKVRNGLEWNGYIYERKKTIITTTVLVSDTASSVEPIRSVSTSVVRRSQIFFK